MRPGAARRLQVGIVAALLALNVALAAAYAAQTVQITPALFIEQILALAFHEHDRLFVINEQRRAEEEVRKARRCSRIKFALRKAVTA